MGDAVLQVITIGDIPGFLPFSLAGDPCDVPCQVVADGYAPVDAVCLIYGALNSQAATGIVFLF